MQMRRTAGGTVRDRIDAADQAIMARLSAESSPVLDRFLPALSRDAGDRAAGSLLVAVRQGRSALPALESDPLDLVAAAVAGVEDDLFDVLPRG